MLIANLASAEIRPDFLMDSDPDCSRLPRAAASMQKHLELWIATLARPETDLQRLSAESIALVSKTPSPGLSDAIPGLEKIVAAESSHPAARFAAARALIALDSRPSAGLLFEASQKHGADLRQLIEPNLASWDFGPVKSVWIQRLEAPGKRPRDFLLAVRGIGKVREASALPLLRTIVFNLVLPPDIRLEAASAMGQLAPDGLEADADQLSHEKRTPPTVNRHCAIRLLARQESEFARRLLTEIAQDAEPSLSAAALQRLNDIDPALVLPLAAQGIKNADANVRWQAARSYVSLPTPERIGPLAGLLDDPHPALRRQICDDLNRLAGNPELNERIRSSATEVLNGPSWRGQEQSALLLGQLEHQPVSRRLVELLNSDRKEVMVSAAWGLRKVADPQTAPAIIDQIRTQTAARKLKTSEELDQQVAHLFEACGRMRVKEAESLMRQYVPKELIMGERSRSAAIWSLGWFNEGVPNDTLAKEFMDRVNDMGLITEFTMVKLQSIISLGRMKAVAFADELRGPISTGTTNDSLSIARRWAVMQITGDVLPPVIPGTIGVSGWFLEPIETPKRETPKVE